MSKGMLIDTTLCIGCRGCQTACKQWNLLPAVDTSFSPTLTNPPDLSAKNYNHVQFRELTDDDGKVSWHFKHWRCLHCLEPDCVADCPIDAIVKLDDGSVVVDKNLCIGLQYCTCPFDLLRFEGRTNKVFKCTFCWDRTKDGLEPACANTCPTKAIKYGDRDELLAEAKSRIQQNPGNYYNHVYGEKEAGGTSVMYLTSVPSRNLGFPNVSERDAWENGITNGGEPKPAGIPLGIPVAVTATIALIAGLLLFRSKRAKAKQGKH